MFGRRDRDAEISEVDDRGDELIKEILSATEIFGDVSLDGSISDDEFAVVKKNRKYLYQTCKRHTSNEKQDRRQHWPGRKLFSSNHFAAIDGSFVIFGNGASFCLA